MAGLVGEGYWLPRADVAGAQNEKPGRRARASAHSYATERYVTSSSGAAAIWRLLEGLVHAGLDRLRGLGRDLLGERGSSLPCAVRLELLARMRAGELDRFRQRLRRRELGEEIESRVGVGTRDLDRLEVESVAPLLAVA